MGFWEVRDAARAERQARENAVQIRAARLYYAEGNTIPFDQAPKRVQSRYRQKARQDEGDQ